MGHFNTFPLKIAVLTLLASLSARAETTAWTLDAFVAHSVQVSDAVNVQNLTYDRSRANYDEKRATFLPTLNATVNMSQTNTDNVDSDLVSASSTTDETYTNTKLNLKANLFNGMQDYSNVKAASSQIEQQKWNLAGIRYTEVQSALASFFTLLQYESDEQNQLKEIEINEKGLKEIQNRIRNGNGRQTEVINMQATLAGNRSDLADTRASLAQERAKAARILKISDTTLKLDYTTRQCKPEQVTGLISKLKVEEKPELRSQQALVKAQQATLSSVKGQILPTLDFTSSYVVADDQTYSQAGRYDFGLMLTVPFPFSPTTKAKVTQASRDYEIAQVQTDLKRRDLERDMTELSRDLQSDTDQIARLEDAKDIGNQNVTAMKKDHQQGLATYSDVLSASATYQQILRRYDRALLKMDLDCYRAATWSADSNQTVSQLKGSQL